MFILLVLSVTLIALSVLTGQEPVIGGNHVMIIQAHALAEAGLERALWALSTPGSPDGISWSTVAGPPYDGTQFIGVATETGASLGGFRVAVSGEGDRQRQVTSTGLVPGDLSPLGSARQDISATAVRFRFPAPPAGIAVRGDLEIGNGVVVDATMDGTCGDRAGTWSTGITSIGAGARVQGRGGDGAVPNEGTDVLQQQAAAMIDAISFTESELQAMKAIAQARGTYYRGAVVFDATRRLPDGLVFIDTVSGQSITQATPDPDLAAVTIADGAPVGPGGSFRGWVVVNGTLSLMGGVSLQGLVYAADRISQSGTARLVGAAMAGHVRSSSTPSRIDARPAGGPAVAWSCEAGRTGGGTIPQRWLVKPGSYREAPG
jgi:hypothetical protein